MFQKKKSVAVKDEEKEASVDEEEIENNIKEVNIIRNKVITEKWIAPIDLALTLVKDMHLHKLNWGNMTDMPNKMKATNTGNTVIVSAKWNHTRPHIRGGSLLSTYVFSQLHFHWGSSEHEGSEHRINGISYPLEMHAVFFKSLYLAQDVALTKEDGVVTLVYLFKLTSETNEVLNLITSKLADIQVPHSSIAIDPTPLSTLLYPFTEDYFMYWGKLQTTVCEHPVLWVISRHAFGVTQSQLKEFRNLLSSTDGNLVKNFRDPCPLNERPVFHVNPSSNLDMVLLPGIVKQDLQLVTIMYNYINECYNKYHAGSKNMNKNMCGDSTNRDYGKVVLPGSGKLTKYDYMYNTMQSSGIKILFLLREITNILHQRILQGETNCPQNSGQDVLCNKENIADTICVGHLNRDNDRRNIRMKSMRRNTEPSILMKPKLCKTRNINNLVRLRNGKHSAVYNKQNCLMKTKTFSSFNRPNANLIQNDTNNTPPVDLSNCKHLFNPQSNRRKADEKPVSKIQTETNRSSKLKQVKDKMSVAVQDGANYYNLLKKQTSKTSFSSSDCRSPPTVENKNKAISEETIFLKSLTKPYFKELATIREESRILRQETPSSLNTALVNEAGNTTSMVGPFPLLSQFGLNETQGEDISQTELLEKTTKQNDVQNCDIKINDDYKDSVNNGNSTLFGVKKFAGLSKQIMNIFHLSILNDNESPALCSLNPNYENEQKTHLEKANDLLDVHDEQEINQNYINAADSIKSDGITMKNRIPMSLNHQVMNLAEDTGIEINTQRIQPVKNDLKSFLSQSVNGDSKLTQNKYCISNNKKEPVSNESMVKQCDDCLCSHMLNQLDVNSIHGDTINMQSVSLAQKTNIFQNDSSMVTNLKLICTDIQGTHPPKTGIVGEANHQGGNSIQRSVNAIKKQFTDEQHSSQQECCSIRNETVILNENGANFTHGNMRKLLKETIIIDDTTAENCDYGNEFISGSSQVAHFAYAHDNSYSVKEDYRNLKRKNDNSNFTSFNEQKPHLNQNSFEIINQINDKDVHVNQHENYETAGNTGNQKIMNSAELSLEAGQADIQQEFTNTIKKTNHSDYGKHCNKDNEELCYKKNEHLYDNDDHSNQKTIQQINEEISSLFGDTDNTSIYSESETVMCKAIPLSFFEENLHVNTTTPVVMQETNTAILYKQVTSLYQNSNFEGAVTNPNSVTSSRIPSTLSVNNDKTLKNKVADQIANVQKHLNRAHNRSEETEEPRNDRGGMVRRNTRTVHFNNPYNKNASNDVVKNNKLPPETPQNTKCHVSKIPKPIPVYTKVRKKLESKIPRPMTRAGTGNEIKYSIRPNNILKSNNKNHKFQDEKPHRKLT